MKLLAMDLAKIIELNLKAGKNLIILHVIKVNNYNKR